MKFRYREQELTFAGMTFYVHEWRDYAEQLQKENRPAVAGIDRLGNLCIIDADQVKFLPEELRICHYYSWRQVDWAEPDHLGAIHKVKKMKWVDPKPARFHNFTVDDGESYAVVELADGDIKLVHAASVTFNPSPPEVKA